MFGLLAARLSFVVSFAALLVAPAATQEKRLELGERGWQQAKKKQPAHRDAVCFLRGGSLVFRQMGEGHERPEDAYRLPGVQAHKRFALSRMRDEVAYVRSSKAGDQLAIVNFASGSSRDIDTPAGVDVRELQWSPDGRWLVYSTSGRDPLQGAVYMTRLPELPGQVARAIRLSSADGHASHPALSPDGTQCAVASTLDQAIVSEGRIERVVRKSAIDVIGLEKRTRQRVLTLDHEVTELAWSPHGVFLAFVAGGKLSVVDTKGEQRLELTAGIRPPSSLAWRPDGKALLVVRRLRKRGFQDGKAILPLDALAVVALDGSVREFPMQAEVWHAAFPLAGDRVASTSRLGLSMLDLRDGKQTVLADEVSFWSHVRW